MAEVVYLLCALASLVCALLLYRTYRMTPSRLLFCSSVCFGGLCLANVILFIDLALLPTTIDLFMIRTFVGVAAVGFLLYGLITETTE